MISTMEAIRTLAAGTAVISSATAIVVIPAIKC
jgi:hypothetical protein